MDSSKDRKQFQDSCSKACAGRGPTLHIPLVDAMIDTLVLHPNNLCTILMNTLKKGHIIMSCFFLHV
jgi:hypothetical protein